MGDLFEEVFVEKAKYLQYWGMNKKQFIKVMSENELYPVEGLNFIDEYPLQTEVLRLHSDNCIETVELLKIFKGLYNGG